MLTMSEWSAVEIAGWAGGRWMPHAPARVSGFSIDTRTLEPGEVFLALAGGRCDGHACVAEAFAKGAGGAIVSAPVQPGGPVLRVADVRAALTAIAAGHRDRLPGRMAALTGSVGKTTVKEMVANALDQRGPTARTPGNWNNELGVPLSLLKMSTRDAFGVFEVAMNHPGEIAPLCRLLRPTLGIMTKVGPAHLEYFASVEAIAREKADLLQSLPAEGEAILSADDRWFDLFRRLAPCRVVTVSNRGDADYVAERQDPAAGRFDVVERESGERAAFVLPRPGRYWIENALLAIAACRRWGLSWEPLQRSLAAFESLPMRWEQTCREGVVFINDAYNANPLSMRAAVEAFEALPGVGCKWLVLGAMRELGAAENEAHREVGRQAAGGAWEGVITVGAQGRLIAAGARQMGWRAEALFECATPEEVTAVLRARLRPGDAVLLKASRAARLEQVLALWEAECAPE